MAREVRIYDIGEAAIIKSFDLFRIDKLPRHRIIEKASELSRESYANIESRFDKLTKMNYLLRHERYEDKPGEKKKKVGVYSVNPEIEFFFECEPFPSETISVEITPERREAHTSHLKDAMKQWIENFPKTPGSYNSSFFFSKVKDCERHLMFPDLINHLPKSGFDVCGRWKRYKDAVKELDGTKMELMMAIEKAISDIFPGLQLRFVDVPDLMRFFEDFDPIRLDDFECCLPSLMYNCLLFELDIDDERLSSAKTKEEYEEIYSDFMTDHNYSRSIEEDIKKSYLSEMGNSVSWGRGWIMELIRVPKSHSSSLGQGIEKATAFFLEGSETTKDLVRNIYIKHRSLEKERKEIIDELNRSLFCQCFSGDCRYLGE